MTRKIEGHYNEKDQRGDKQRAGRKKGTGPRVPGEMAARS